MFDFDFGKARRIMIGFINVVIHVRDVPWWAWLLMIAMTYPATAGSIWQFLSGQGRFEDLISITAAFVVFWAVWRILVATPILSRESWDENEWITKNLPSRHLWRYTIILLTCVKLGSFFIALVFDVLVSHRMAKLSEVDKRHIELIGLELVKADPSDLIVRKNGIVEVILDRSRSAPNMVTACKRGNRNYYNFHDDGRPNALYSLRDMLAIRKVIKENEGGYWQYSRECESYSLLRRQRLIDFGVPAQCIDQPRGTVYWCGFGKTGYCECR